MENKLRVLKNFTYEIIERITRFINHLEEIEKQFYENGSNSTDKINLINNYKESLHKLLNLTITGYKEVYPKEETAISNQIELLKEILYAINYLHTNLLAVLPRPSEPVELDRFKRVIYKQIVQLENDKRPGLDISISINEGIGEEINLDPLGEYKIETLNKIIRDFNSNNSKSIEEFTEAKDDEIAKLHITIPRIDAANTYRWSSLIHEMAHSLMDDVVFDEKNIAQDFLKFVGNDQFVIDFFSSDNNSKYGYSPDQTTLRHWLVECWCDLFACILIGPSLYFSQYLAFLNAPVNSNEKHPPSLFRLYLIESILSGRFSSYLSSYLEETHIRDCEELISIFEDKNKLKFSSDPNLARISNYFKQYFKKHFFASGDEILIHGNNETLNAKLQKLVKKYVTVQLEIITYLVDRLNKGLPIPSIKTKNNEGDYEEIPTYVQEIFLASWVSRSDTLRKNILDAVEEETVIEDLKSFYKKNIEEPILRHDQAVLKSIQVSEWFDFFNNEKERPSQIDVFQPDPFHNNMQNGALVDYEIEALILQDELKVIPIMDIKEQIGTTSLDIRLGTSFQMFYPDQYGIIDFTSNSSDKEFKTFSKRVNLDFIKGITITPGQFILAHSMEYVKLPDYLCGNLEGRSSFARLGIEIHMTAGFIDPGFEGVITFEIYNAGANAVKLYPGMRIGQMRFEHNNSPKRPYSQRHKVKYKGLLEHNVSRQNKDIEVVLIKERNSKGKHD